MPIIRTGKTNRANNAHYDYGLQWSEVDEFYSPGELPVTLQEFLES